MLRLGWTALAILLTVGVDLALAQVGEFAADSLVANDDSTTALAVENEMETERDIGDVVAGLLNREPKPEAEIEVETKGRRHLSKTLLPSIGYNPSFGSYAGLSVALGGWLGDPQTTKLSAGSIGGTYSTTGQLSLQFKSDFYLPDNAWALKGDWRYLDTSQPTYGLGPANDDQQEFPMDFVLYRLYQTVYKRVHQSRYFVGVGYHFDRYDKILDERAEAGDITPYLIYSGGLPTRSQSSGISINVLTDTRDNPINAHRGSFWNASLRSFVRELGSDENRQTLWSDFRGYIPLGSRDQDVLAIWNTLWFTFGKPGYLELPAIGWDTYGRGGRGWVQGRIRGPNQTYTELEYRKQLSRDGLWGGVAFLNLTSTTPPNGGKFGAPDWGGGLGVRLKFNKQTDTNLAVDAGYGQDEIIRVFFGLQEVF